MTVVEVTLTAYWRSSSLGTTVGTNVIIIVPKNISRVKFTIYNFTIRIHNYIYTCIKSVIMKLTGPMKPTG